MRSESITLNEVPTIQMRESKQDCSDNIKCELELFEDQIIVENQLDDTNWFSPE